ncbi:MAG: phosphatidate cytidylyltransferase [Clostridia bacterium]|nr:phosphatidate cytidylyltransferase [Clostridia bacterium]
MKTRIISATIAIFIFISVLYTRQFTDIPLILAVLCLSAIATLEVLYNTTINRYKPAVWVAVIYSALAPLSFTQYFNMQSYFLLSVVFVCIMFSFGVFAHNKLSVQQCVMSFALPTVLSFAFGSLLAVLSPTNKQGLLQILLLCGFAWGTDTGAYFTGVFFGKHKIAPEISPKKTAEGCIGGILFCAVYTFLVSFFMLHNLSYSIWITALSPLFAVAGMIGDLSASLLKRAYNIKDYGNIMPGHGGIMDRFDSILFISPCFLCVLEMF